MSTVSVNAASYINANSDGQYRAAVRADGPIRLYDLGDSGSSAIDSSGNNGPAGTWGSSVVHGGICTASDYVTGSAVFPNAATATPDPNAIITFPLDSALVFNGTSFTVEFMMQYNISNGTNAGGQDCSYFNLGDDTGIRIANHVDKGSDAFVYIGGVLALSELGGIPYYEDSYHVAVTYDVATNTVKYYQSGGLCGSATVAPGTFSSATGLVLGQRGQTGNPTLGGAFQYVAIYDKVLSATQIATHAKASGGIGNVQVPPYPGNVVRFLSARAGLCYLATLGAASRLTAKVLVNAQASSRIKVGSLSQVGAASRLIANAKAMLAAQAHVFVPTFQVPSSVGAHAIVAVKLRPTLSASAIIVHHTTTSMRADAVILPFLNASASLRATAHVSQIVDRSMSADSRVAMLRLLTLVAGATIKPKPVKLLLAAAAIIADHSTQSIGAASFILSHVVRSIGAHAYLTQSSSSSIRAASTVSDKLTQSAGAASLATANLIAELTAACLVLAQGILTMEAETRIRAHGFDTLDAASLLTASIDMSLRPRMVIITTGTVSVLAGASVSADSEITVEATSIVSADLIESLDAASYVCIIAEQTLDAASRMTQTAQTAIAAGALIGLGSIAQYMTAQAIIVELQHTFGLLEACALIVGQATASLSAGAAVAFVTELATLDAAASIYEPFSPTLYAQAYIVQVGRDTLAAGGRVGRLSVASSNRTVYVEPFTSDADLLPGA